MVGMEIKLKSSAKKSNKVKDLFLLGLIISMYIFFQTLFIKNLTRNVTEMDLSDLFGHFQGTSENKIIYRLMNGKMRGQAFVTFQSK